MDSINVDYFGGSLILVTENNSSVEERIKERCKTFALRFLEKHESDNNCILYLVFFADTDKRSKFIESLEGDKISINIVDAWDQIQELTTKFN